MTTLTRRGLVAASLSGAALLVLPRPLRAQGRPLMDVAKDPYCGCCGAWADLAREAGFDVTLRDVEDMAAEKAAAGVPDDLWSCHTARVGGYVIEGHVPFDAVARLLAERPDIAGLAVPGMPMGSPGMGDDPAARYDVIAWGGAAGNGTVFHEAGKG
jgi:hypothetical protein